MKSMKDHEGKKQAVVRAQEEEGRVWSAPVKPCFAGCQEACFTGQANHPDEI